MTSIFGGGGIPYSELRALASAGGGSSPAVPPGNSTMASGTVVVAPPNSVQTLPTSPAAGMDVTIVANENVTQCPQSNTPVTVQCTSGGKIFGEGILTGTNPGATSFLLGAPGAYARLFCPDGVNWRVIGGEADTGWVHLAYPGGSAFYIADQGNMVAWRQRGAKVDLTGALSLGPSFPQSPPNAVIATNLPTSASYYWQQNKVVQTGNTAPYTYFSGEFFQSGHNMVILAAQYPSTSQSYLVFFDGDSYPYRP